MDCAKCGSIAVFWGHNGTSMKHQWQDQDESTCSCKPALLCGTCHRDLIVDHGFLVMDQTVFPDEAAGLIH